MSRLAELEKERTTINRKIHKLKGPTHVICGVCYHDTYMKNNSKHIERNGCYWKYGITPYTIYLSEWHKDKGVWRPNEDS